MVTWTKILVVQRCGRAHLKVLCSRSLKNLRHILGIRKQGAIQVKDDIFVIWIHMIPLSTVIE